MGTEVKLGTITVDCADGQELQRFYGELLGWRQCVKYGQPAVQNSDGVTILFVALSGYVEPVWPEVLHTQQKQIHFDFQVADIAAYVQRAETLGARKTEAQFGGQAFVTMRDPAGHPFCLCQLD